MERIYQQHTEFLKNIDISELIDKKIESKRFLKNLIDTLYLVKDGLTEQLYYQLVSDIIECFEELNDEKICKIKSMSVICISRIFSKHFTFLLLDDIDEIIGKIKINIGHKINNIDFGKRVEYRIPRHADLINNLYMEVILPRISIPDYI